MLACPSRRGVTLLELLVTLVIAGIALSLIAAISARQQRIVADLQENAALSSQLGDAISILPIDLAAVSSIAGDIREARDTSIELRATIATSVACDTIGGRLVLSPPSDGAATYAGMLSPIEVGDTAWVLVPTDSAEDWRPFRVGGVAPAAPGACAARGPLLSPGARNTARISLTLDGLTSSAPLGAAIRVTRPMRYSLYRGSDAQWYLGQRDWNNASTRFNTVQPVSGPFLSPASAGLVFRYADSLGADISSPVADTKTIALVRVDLRGQTRSAERALSTRNGRRVDSIGQWVLLRNRR
jgi:prepilin-type N-terminal cleavage/methylation domain-containing protein